MLPRPSISRAGAPVLPLDCWCCGGLILRTSDAHPRLRMLPSPRVASRFTGCRQAEAGHKGCACCLVPRFRYGSAGRLCPSIILWRHDRPERSHANVSPSLDFFSSPLGCRCWLYEWDGGCHCCVAPLRGSLRCCLFSCLAIVRRRWMSGKVLITRDSLRRADYLVPVGTPGIPPRPSATACEWCWVLKSLRAPCGIPQPTV